MCKSRQDPDLWLLVPEENLFLSSRTLDFHSQNSLMQIGLKKRYVPIVGTMHLRL